MPGGVSGEGRASASRSPGTPATRLGGASAPKPSSTCSGVQTVPASVSGAVARPPALWVSRSSICTKRPESGRLDQSALAVTWKRTTRPSPSWRPVTSGVPSSRLASTRPGRSGSGCAITWLEMSTSCGTGEAGEGARLREGLQPPRRAPGHRAADRAAAGAQPHRQQRILLELADAGLRQPRAGEADEQAALLDPGLELRRARRRRGCRRRRGSSTSGAAFSISASGASITSAKGSSALAQVVQRIDQILRLALGAARHQPDLAPAHRVVGEHHAGGGTAVGELHPADAVAQLDRHVEREIEAVGAGGESAGGRARAPARCRSGRVRSRSPPTGRARRGVGPQRADLEGAVLEPRRRQRQRGLRAAPPASPGRGRAARGRDPPRRRGRCRRSATASRRARPAPAIQPAQAARSGAQGCGARPAQPLAPVRGGAPGQRLDPAAAAPTSAPPRRAGRRGRRSSSAAAARSMRRAQSGASPQPPSRSTRSGAPEPSGRGFSTGPAKARIAAASASMRSSSSHQGVRSGIFSGSVRPRSSRTPGKARRPGAGGTARSSHQRTGSVASPSQEPGREEGHRSRSSCRHARSPTAM